MTKTDTSQQHPFHLKDTFEHSTRTNGVVIAKRSKVLLGGRGVVPSTDGFDLGLVNGLDGESS